MEKGSKEPPPIPLKLWITSFEHTQVVLAIKWMEVKTSGCPSAPCSLKIPARYSAKQNDAQIAHFHASAYLLVMQQGSIEAMVPTTFPKVVGSIMTHLENEKTPVLVAAAWMPPLESLADFGTNVLRMPLWPLLQLQPLSGSKLSLCIPGPSPAPAAAHLGKPTYPLPLPSPLLSLCPVPQKLNTLQDASAASMYHAPSICMTKTTEYAACYTLQRQQTGEVTSLAGYSLYSLSSLSMLT